MVKIPLHQLRGVMLASTGILQPVCTYICPIRTAFILKRRNPVPLVAKGEEDYPRKLLGRHYVYDLVENTELRKKPLVQVILKTYVEGLGQKGDCVSVKRNTAYNKLLLPGLADYASEDALQISEQEKNNAHESRFSTKSALLVVKYLEKQVLAVVLNKEIPWTIEPWHIRVSFRKAGIIVPESAIELPKQKISGPNLDLELKDFVVTVTVNKKEKAHVRCRIHHWSTNPGDRLPYVDYPWTLSSAPIFEEEAAILDKLPIPPYPLEEKEL